VSNAENAAYDVDHPVSFAPGISLSTLQAQRSCPRGGATILDHLYSQDLLLALATARLTQTAQKMYACPWRSIRLYGLSSLLAHQPPLEHQEADPEWIGIVKRAEL
jgi:hypothetical protein